MPAVLAVPLFLVSLSVTLAAARLFARRLDRLGVRFGFPEALIGLLTAVAADGPNVSSALFALAKGAHDVGVGVLVGSNAFQLAAMIGVSALLAGSVLIPRETLALEGIVGLLVTVLAAALLFRWLSPVATVLIAAVVVAPYLTLVIVGARLLDRLHASLAFASRATCARIARASWARAGRRHLGEPHPPPARADRGRRRADRRGERRDG